ncbi:MAG: Fic family protein [Candidatus Aenigmatarchaeota archaeon]
MALRIKAIKGKHYYYLDFSYFIAKKSKTFSKYIGLKKPPRIRLSKIGHDFKSEIILKLAGKNYTTEFVSKDDLIKALLFRDAFDKKFASLSTIQKRQHEVDSTLIFTLTTLVTEDIDVTLRDVCRALEKTTKLTMREQISKNMLNAIKSIKHTHTLDKKYILDLHKTIMAGVEEKTPGNIRHRQVYLHIRDSENPSGREISYRPPHFTKVNSQLETFVKWYNSTKLNPIEKAVQTHYRIYKIHPFLDGNKRICRLLLNKTLIDAGFSLLNVSVKKDAYFQSLIESVEKDNTKILTNFMLKEFLRQVREFLNNVSK